MNKTQNGSGASNLKQEHLLQPKDKVSDYVYYAKQIFFDQFEDNITNSVAMPFITEVAKMIQLEEHREDK